MEYINKQLAIDEIEKIRQRYENSDDCAELVAQICKKAIELVRPESVKGIIYGHWMNEGPYEAFGGVLKKSQQCPICYAVYISGGNDPWPNHPYCSECGARLYTEAEFNEMVNRGERK